MNKTYKSGMMALSAVAFFTSCSESESLQQAHLSTDQINFIASMAHQWDANDKSAPQNPSSRSAGERDNEAPIHVNANLAKPLYLHPVVQDGIHIWSKQGTPITRSGAPIEDVEQERVVQTRGSMKNDISAYSKFGVTALYPNGDDYVSLFDNAIATNSGKYWNIPDASNNTWPIDSKVSFHAYAPHSSELTHSSESNSMLSSSPDLANVQTNIHYEAKVSPADIEKQPDLIVATNAALRSKTDANTPVALQFSHALTAVSFAMSSDLADVIGSGAQLTSVSLHGIPNEGDCQLIAKDDKHSTSSANWNWKLGSAKGTYTFDLSTKNVIVGSDLALTDDNQTLMMIPQTLPDGAKLEFTFNLNGKPQVLTVDLKEQKWEAGQSVIYKLSAKAINTLDATAVTYPSTWTASSFPKSSFTTDDAIGLYVVDKNNQIVESNVKLTLGSDNKWATSKKFLKLAGYKYFAYYPYSATAPKVDIDDVDKTATDFFAISSLSPASVQNTKEALLAQDFQVAKGVVGPNASTLTFQMEHSMGLAVLNLESKEIAQTRRFYTNKYTFYYPDLTGHETTEPKEGKDADYTDDAAKVSVCASNNFEGNKPYNVSGNKWLHVIPLNKATSFMAADQDGTHRTAWGKLSTKLKLCSITPTTSEPVVSRNIYSDADFYYLARVYTCTHSVEEFTAPVAGEYKLECWGAQGGWAGDKTPPYIFGGKGGYCSGMINLRVAKVLYIVVGGQGTGANSIYGGYGGYNGGGNSGLWREYTTMNGAGGGATHIASTYGLLSTVNKTDLYLVAGGGGGSASNFSGGTTLGGFGGGTSGGCGDISPNTDGYYGLGGTQTDGGGYVCGGTLAVRPIPYKGSYGQGGNGNEGAGGGAGLYGGGGASVWCGGGGGSSYIGSVTSGETKAGNLEMPTPNGGTETGHSGNGACVITQLSFN